MLSTGYKAAVINSNCVLDNVVTLYCYYLHSFINQRRDRNCSTNINVNEL